MIIIFDSAFDSQYALSIKSREHFGEYSNVFGE